MPFARRLPGLRGTLAGVSEAQPAPALIAEATKRAGVIWITAGGRRPRPVWHVWRDGAYVLTGPGEQDVPGLTASGPVTVTVPSKDTGGCLVTWTAQVSRVEPGSAEWSSIIGALLAGRLNEAAGPGAVSPAGRWAQTGNVYRLTPVNARPGDPVR
jgi:hypothetical protein